MSELRGIGLDLCEISRMEPLLQNETWKRRVLTTQEQAYLAARGAMAASSLAAMWAAKEAALKALSIGISVPMTEIEVLHRDSGQPYYALYGSVKELSQNGSLLLSVTHEGGMAAAVCVWSV